MHDTLKMASPMSRRANAYLWLVVLSLLVLEDQPHEAAASLGTQSPGTQSVSSVDYADLPVMYE